MKKKNGFFCQNCGYESAKWMGQCPACHEWNSFVEEPSAGAGKKTFLRSKAGSHRPQSLDEIEIRDDVRTSSGLAELDRVLGGGIVEGSLILIGGDPGIGKSTLLLQVSQKLSAAGKKVLYISGEESPAQIRMRASRLGEGKGDLRLFAETNLETIRAVIEEEQPSFVIIDSIQTMYSDEVASAPGSVSQVRESTAALMMIAKSYQVTIFIVGHVTKEGAVAGPRVLEHMVDTVLYFEGDRHASYRILRGIKNRFGSTNEIGVFEMHSQGLVEVENPSEYMLSGRPENASGSLVTCSIEGTRPLLVEIQALVCKSNFGIPRRTAAGTDFNRVNLLMAVLEKRCRLEMSACDAYVNIAGGIRIQEPALDLGISLAVASSFLDVVIPEDSIAFGEVGLSGEVRAVSSPDIRVAEAKRLGFRRVILPHANLKTCEKIDGIQMEAVKSIREAIDLIKR